MVEHYVKSEDFCLIRVSNELQQDLEPPPNAAVSLSCSRGSPSRGGILTPTLSLCAACSPGAA